jgi:hypothetical protein
MASADGDFSADIERVFESIHRLTEANEASLERGGISVETLREIFAEGFLTVAEPEHAHGDFYYDGHFAGYRNEDRAFQRDQFFYWMGYLGYYPEDFDWDSWRDLYGND